MLAGCVRYDVPTLASSSTPLRGPARPDPIQIGTNASARIPAVTTRGDSGRHHQLMNRLRSAAPSPPARRQTPARTRPSSPSSRSITHEAIGCVRLPCSRHRKAALITSPPTAPGITRLNSRPMKPRRKRVPISEAHPKRPHQLEPPREGQQHAAHVEAKRHRHQRQVDLTAGLPRRAVPGLNKSQIPAARAPPASRAAIPSSPSCVPLRCASSSVTLPRRWLPASHARGTCCSLGITPSRPFPQPHSRQRVSRTRLPQVPAAACHAEGGETTLPGLASRSPADRRSCLSSASGLII